MTEAAQPYRQCGWGCPRFRLGSFSTSCPCLQHHRNRSRKACCQYATCPLS